jgi:hypothetical protein
MATVQVPAYVLTSEYTTGNVDYIKTNYLYFPIQQTDTSIAILLNKTGNIEADGDSLLVAHFIEDTSSMSFD